MLAFEFGLESADNRGNNSDHILGNIIGHAEYITAVSLVLGQYLGILLDFGAEKGGNFESSETEVELAERTSGANSLFVQKIIMPYDFLWKPELLATVSIPELSCFYPNSNYLFVQQKESGYVRANLGRCCECEWQGNVQQSISEISKQLLGVGQHLDQNLPSIPVKNLTHRGNHLIAGTRIDHLLNVGGGAEVDAQVSCHHAELVEGLRWMAHHRMKQKYL